MRPAAPGMLYVTYVIFSLSLAAMNVIWNFMNFKIDRLQIRKKSEF